MFDCQLRESCNINRISIKTFKKSLDELITKLPDWPTTQGCIQQKSSFTNTIIGHLQAMKHKRKLRDHC